MPRWWGERRFGLFVHASLASVPAWSPIGESSSWYRSHMGDDVSGTSLHPRPMVEVLAHHRDRWGHIDTFDDFLPLLTFDDFDAEEWGRLVVDSGATYTVFAGKHHDGLAWWDAPNTDRTTMTAGPRRNVLAEYAAACERNSIVFGTSYSLLDWAETRSSDAYLDEVVRPQVIDLVERYGSSVLRADGQSGNGLEHGRIGELLARLWAIDSDIVINDRWGATPDDGPPGRPDTVRTFEHDPPGGIVDGPWELFRALGSSVCHNRAERAEHHLSGYEIVGLLTEVVAKGGHLLLGVGPDSNGAIPDLQIVPLREAGRWIRRHQPMLAVARPWMTWGDEHVRYLDVEGVLHAIAVDGHTHFDALASGPRRVDAVELLGPTGGSDSISFHQDDRALHLDLHRAMPDRRTRGVDDVCVYRIAQSPAEQPIVLFEPEPREPIALAPLMRDVSVGDIVQLGDGVYVGPVTVPDGVVIRGLGGHRTLIDGGAATAVTLGGASRLEHLRVTVRREQVAGGPSAAVVIVGPSATVLGCRIDGHIVVRAHDALVRATAATGIIGEDVDRVSVSRCQLAGMGWDIGVHLVGGSGHEVDSSEFAGHLCAIRVSDAHGTVVRGNNISARWWGVHLLRTEGAHVHGNFVNHTMRGIDVDGGAQALIDANAVCDGDSGCIVQWGASDCDVNGNRWERCRIGVLQWEAPGLRLHANEAIDLHDTPLVTGP